jgi:hypothetical protein
MSAPAAPPWPVFDVAEMAQEASEQAGIELRSGYSLRTARRSLELLCIEWANRGLNLWTIEGPEAIELLPGEPEYLLPDDTVDLVEHIVRTWWTNPPAPGSPRWLAALGMRHEIQADDRRNQLALGRGRHETALRLADFERQRSGEYPGYEFTDLPLDRMTLPEYAAIPNKFAPGRPTILNMRRTIHPYFRIWMVPPGGGQTYHLLYWRLRRMATLGAGGLGQAEIPWRFIPAMISGLAYYLALKSKEPQATQRVPILKAAYEEQFTLASDEDRDRAAFRFVPGGYERIGV